MKRRNYYFRRALAMLLCATLLITNLEMTAFAAAGVTDADSSGIVAEETITDKNLLSPDDEDQTGKEEFQQEERSLTEDGPAEESNGASEEDEMSEPTEHPSDGSLEASEAADDTLTGDQTESTVEGKDGSSRSETANDGKNDITETVEITAWDELKEAFCTDCSIMLMQDIEADYDGDPLTVPAGVTITLNLNGHTLDITPEGHFIVINGSLTMIGEGNIEIRNYISSIDVNGTFTKKGGSINSHFDYGNNVYVSESGNFIMEGGSIVRGNHGVYVSGSTFTMKGGSIHNSGCEDSDDYRGVTLRRSGTFIMEDGSITCDGHRDCVTVYDGSTFTMNGGSLTGGECGVFIMDTNTSFTMNGGLISGNEDGVYITEEGSSFTMNGGTISGNKVSAVLNYHGIFTLCGGKKLDVKGLYVPEGSTLTIYGQSAGTAKIYSHPSGGAAIGGYSEHNNGNIVIHGGTVEANGHDHCEGIG